MFDNGRQVTIPACNSETGCFMAAIKSLINLLTLLFALLYSGELFSSYAIQEGAKTHLRWILAADRKQLVIKKRGNLISIMTLNNNLYSKLKKDIEHIPLDNKYISGVKFNDSYDNNALSIDISLPNSKVEFFTFYRDKDNKYVIDFWKDNIDDISDSNLSTTINEIESKVSATSTNSKERTKETSSATTNLKVGNVYLKPKTPVKSRGIASINKPSDTIISKAQNKKNTVVSKPKKHNSEYLDFRYGAPFYWDYAPLAPNFDPLLDIASKTPEYFYPIEDREYKKNKKEAHLQLSINMYRKQKWGLMYKSISLYEQEYKKDINFQVNEYLKANALLRDNINKGNRVPSRPAINILKNLEERSTVYNLKKSVMKYLLQYYISNKEYVGSLKLSKKLFVVSKKEFDYDESKTAMEATLFSLAKLNQLSKIREILADKKLSKFISKERALVYRIYTYMKFGNIDDAIRVYEKNAPALAKPIHNSVVFNLGEAYFRKGKFKKSIKLFDEFISDHSYHSYSSKTRVRLALIYELIGRENSGASILYKNAINRSSYFEDSLEARIRYVALRNIRKKKPSKNDIETRVFLDIDKNKKKAISKNIKKILWITRLRIFITDKEYKKALAYLEALPIDSLKPSEKVVFRADGAEVIFGIISEHYRKGRYADVVKTWNTYKNKYVYAVANDPHINFLVGRSYLHLGLYDAFDNIHKRFAGLSGTYSKTYPLWIKRSSTLEKSSVNQELEVIKYMHMNNWNLANKSLKKLISANPSYVKVKYYKGIVSFNTEDYTGAVDSLEDFLSKDNSSSLLDHNEIAGVISAYSESLYNLGQFSKFAKVSKALLRDIESYRGKNNKIDGVKAKIIYLNIEILASQKTKGSYAELEREINNFLSLYKNTKYDSRVRYLLGLSYISNNKIRDGKKVLDGIISNSSTPSYLRKLAKSELATLSMREKSL